MGHHLAPLTEADLRLLRAAIALARRAHGNGNPPFGAVLADACGNVLLEAENTQTTERDFTGHAELNLIRLVSRRLDPDTLATCTLYASTEPCPMCAGAIQMSPLRRVVYALGAERLRASAGNVNPRRLSCREVLERSGRPIDVLGPALEDEALAARGQW